MPMTPEAKKALSTTIRGLRERLLDDLAGATEAAYRRSVRVQDTGLPEAARVRRGRLEAWIAEQQRADATGAKKRTARTEADYWRDVQGRAAYTLLNRLVVLRLMEATGLRAPAVITGGWESVGYLAFRDVARALVRDDTEGYAYLLQLVFEDLATELPGIFGSAGPADLVPVPAGTLRHVVQTLDDPALASCWTDDMTLGWVYQYWNDPAREALDTKLNAGGKVEPHEIASKTQMFTERYMVDWLLQNSLGPMWLAMCEKHGWEADVHARGADGVSLLERLEARREDWRNKRERGDVALTDLMPLHSDAERRWAYYVPQPIPQDAVAKAPDTVRELAILDPAVGSGHFLVVAFDLLFALYREQARHRGEEGGAYWTDEAIVECILAANLHGIDLDPRAVQIAAAAMWLKAKQTAPKARPERMNLVASNLRLAGLPDDDPALVELRREVERETGIPGELTNTLVRGLQGADHLGSLLKVGDALKQALDKQEELGRVKPEQGGLFGGFSEKKPRVLIGREEAQSTLLERIEGFLAKHTGGDDLGLRLRGEQLAAGVRFVRIVREGTYDLVVANPPYQGTSKMADAKYVQKAYPLGKADLYAAFLLRGLELVKPGGVSAMLTMRNWMFIKQYAGLREELLGTYDLRALGDFDRGAFEDVPDEVVSVAVACLAKAVGASESVALCPTPRDDRTRDGERTQRKRAGTRCHEGRQTFDPAALRVVPEWPLVYWWRESELQSYARTPLLGNAANVRQGLATSDNARFLRGPTECSASDIAAVPVTRPPAELSGVRWAPYVKGAAGSEWFEPLSVLIDWRRHGLQLKAFHETRYVSYTKRVPNEDCFFTTGGVAFSPIGSVFSGRAYRYRSIFDAAGCTVFGLPVSQVVCLFNSGRARAVLSALNPSISFKNNDVERLPLWAIEEHDRIFATMEGAWTAHESHREPSVEFKQPGPSPWRHAQDWAQVAVDRPEGDPLPEYVEVLDSEAPTDHLSFALGVALGRFGAKGSPQEGILDPATADLSRALPHGILFLDTTLDAIDSRDGFGHPAAAPLHAAWASHCPAIGTKRSLRNWLALDFFKDVHRTMYENRPIHWPLSSASKTFVAWVNIHRMSDQTLAVLLADHLNPTLKRLRGELDDLRAARDSGEGKAARAADKQVGRVIKARDELIAFIADVEACADKGPPPPTAKVPARERDAAYDPNLDDGVMINSAALWPLLAPQWNKPKAWWTELATAKGRKDYDWSHLAMRYWPTRVDAKCRGSETKKGDPSLGVAHGCFWLYHPERAWAWELRLQQEIGPDFRIEEGPYTQPDGTASDDHIGLRAALLRDAPAKAVAAVQTEAVRRIGRGESKAAIPSLTLLEPGLWSEHPRLCWDVETHVIAKQKAPFALEAPDAAPARVAFRAENPGLVEQRALLLAALDQPKLFKKLLGRA